VGVGREEVVVAGPMAAAVDGRKVEVDIDRMVVDRGIMVEMVAGLMGAVGIDRRVIGLKVGTDHMAIDHKEIGLKVGTDHRVVIEDPDPMVATEVRNLVGTRTDLYGPQRRDLRVLNRMERVMHRHKAVWWAVIRVDLLTDCRNFRAIKNSTWKI